MEVAMSKEMKDNYIRVRLGHEEKERLDHESEIQHRTKSEIVRMALDEFLKKSVE